MPSLDVPKAHLECLQKIEGFEDFNASTEALTMLKPIYGLKDVPRAWGKKFHQVLIQWVSCLQLYSEPELHCARQGNTFGECDAIARAKEHDKEQHESGESRTVKAQLLKFCNFLCLLSVHVGAARRKLAGSLLEQRNRLVGQCEVGYSSFLHIGVQHEHSPGVVLTHQHVYIDSISLIEPTLLIGEGDAELCFTVFHESRRSVFGVVA